MNWTFSSVVMAVLMVGCGNSRNPMQSSGEFSQSQALAKPAVPSPPLMISSPLTYSANAVAGTAEIRPFEPDFIGVNLVVDLDDGLDVRTVVRVQFARSVSGRLPQFDAGIQVSFSPDSRQWECIGRVYGASGMYLVRAITIHGEILGEWSSVPLNRGDLNELVLVPGRPAEFVHQGRIWAMIMEGEEFPLGFAYSVIVNREAGYYQVSVTIPGIKPGQYQMVWRGESFILVGVGVVGPEGGKFWYTGDIPTASDEEPVDLWSIGVGPTRGELVIFSP